MNYLAHLYLSGDSKDLRIGNFIGDHIRGKDIKNYSGDILKGIFLHRAIDDFTDAHAIVKQSKKRLQPQFRKYSGVIVDMFYDHFLGKNWKNYSKQNLEDFTEMVYQEIHSSIETLPKSVQRMLPFMQKQNWLLAYSKIEGINRALTGLSKRTKFVSNMEFATLALQEDYDLYENEFETFFEELRIFSQEFIENEQI